MMEVDTEKLLRLIEARSAIYNSSCRDHANKQVIEKLWEDIANEMQAPVTDCKTKWTSLRSAFSRQLREEKTQRLSHTGKRRKKWYLADAMSFLREHMHQHRQSRLNSASPDIEEIVDVAETKSTPNSSAIHSPVPVQISKTTVPTIVPTIVPQPPVAPPIPSPVAAPVMQQRPPPEKPKTMSKDEAPNSANALFFQSMLADFERLSKKSQRKFRMRMMQLMNEVQEEEEENESMYVTTAEPMVASTPTTDTINTASISIDHYKYELDP